MPELNDGRARTRLAGLGDRGDGGVAVADALLPRARLAKERDDGIVLRRGIKSLETTRLPAGIEERIEQLLARGRRVRAAEIVIDDHDVERRAHRGRCSMHHVDDAVRELRTPEHIRARRTAVLIWRR
jgi:hypothetical protein